MSPRPTIVLVDRISGWSVLAIALLAPGATVWHFDGLTVGARRIAMLASHLHLFRGPVRQVDAHVGEMRSANGSSPLVGLVRNARAVSSRIEREWVRQHPMLRALEPEWPAESLGFHVARLFDGSFREERMRVALAAWLVERERHTADEALLLVARKPWLGFIADVARQDGLSLVGYPHLHGAGRLLGRSLLLLPHLWKRFRISRPSHVAAEKPRRREGAVGIRYGHRAVSLDVDRHSEFFWLAEGSAPSRAVLYDHDRALPPDLADALGRRGISVRGGIPRTTGPALRLAMRHWKRIWGAFLVGAILHRRYPVALARAMSSLALDYASWHDFFRSEGIRVNVVGSNGSSGQVLALDALGGVSVNYQYSIANIVAPTSAMMAGETVQLVYSPVFAELMRSLDSPTKRFVVTGPLSDGAEAAAAALRSSPRVHATRERLRGAGARFVLCFFDENSIGRWDLPSSNADAARDYEFLMSWLEEDPDLGLVVKPKRPWDLRERIGQESARVDRMVAAGRCVIIGERDLSRDTHAVEAALAADLSIGKLSGGTAALESFLVGVPSIMVDVDAMHDHPLRTWNEGNVVFDGWRSAREAVDRHRSDPTVFPGLGDWSARISELDPFQDGRATDRMRDHIVGLLGGLQAGSSLEAVLATLDATAGRPPTAVAPEAAEDGRSPGGPR